MLYNSCRIHLANNLGSISRHITPLVINSLRGRHTHVHMHTDVRTETILRNQHVPGLKTEWNCDFQDIIPGIFSKNKLRGQIESFKNRGGQNLSQVEFSRAANQVHLSTDV